MKNLDTSILNQSILDESFSNFTSDDVLSLRQQIKDAEAREKLLRANYDLMLSRRNPNNPASIVNTDVAGVSLEAAQRNLNDLKNRLASIPKSVIDAVDKNIKLQADLAASEASKNQAADIAAIEKQNKAIQEAIDKSKGVTDILSGKNVIPPSTLPLPSDSKIEQKTTMFTTKNIIIATSVLGASVGIYFLVKKLIK